MNRKTFALSLDRGLAHNTISLNPKTDLKVTHIKTSLPDGSEMVILDNPIEIEEPTSIRYASVVSSRIFIEIESHYVDELTIDDLLTAEISLAKYDTLGEYSSEEGRLSFHKYLSVVSDIKNVKDTFFKAELGIKALDRYDNIVYSDIIPVSLNEDGWMVEYRNRPEPGNIIELPVAPSEVKVLIGGEYTDEFTVLENKVTFDIPAHTDTYILYRPFYADNGTFSKVTENISINSNGEVMLRDDKCQSILYTLNLSIYNTDISSSNHTPIIKSLAVVVTD